MPDETPNGDLPGQSGGLNLDGTTRIGGNAVGRDSITQTTATTNTTVAEGGPVARYAVVGLVIIAALAIVIVALLAFQSHPITPGLTPTASVTATVAPSLTASATALPIPPLPTATATQWPSPTDPPTVAPSPTETPLPPSPTQSPTEKPTASATTSPPPESTLPPSPTEPTATPTPIASATAISSATAIPSATVTVTASPSPTPTLYPTPVLPLYDNFASSCLKKEKWMLDWVWQSPLPTPGAPVCLDARPEFMDADDGLIVFIDPIVALPKSVTHALTSAQMGYYRQVEVTFTLNKVDVFTDTRTAYLSAGVSVRLARPADADLEIRLQGSNVGGKFGYQITSLLDLKDGSGHVSGDKMPYLPGQPVVVAFRVKGNKLTAYVNNQPIAGPFSILSEPSAVNIGYHVDAETSLDGTFSEVRILQMPASEIRPTAAPALPATPQTPSARTRVNP